MLLFLYKIQHKNTQIHACIRTCCKIWWSFYYHKKGEKRNTARSPVPALKLFIINFLCKLQQIINNVKLHCRVLCERMIRYTELKSTRKTIKAKMETFPEKKLFWTKDFLVELFLNFAHNTAGIGIFFRQ